MTRIDRAAQGGPLCFGGLLLLGFAGWRCKAAATGAPTPAELLSLLGRHLLPALVHTLVYSSPHIGATAMTATTPASEQNPAESQQSDSLPEGDLPPSEQRRQQPVPQMHNELAANPDEKWDCQYC